MECDMTPQRYGEIANSAGKGVTDEAVIRGSMGSVIIEFIFDKILLSGMSPDPLPDGLFPAGFQFHPAEQAQEGDQ